MAESLLMFPLTVLIRIAEATGTEWLCCCIWLVFPALVLLWLILLLGRDRSKASLRSVVLFLVAVVGLPVLSYLSETVFFAHLPTAPWANCQLAVVQSYFCLSALTYCEAYWNNRNRDAYFVALLTTTMACLIWISVALFWVATLS